MRDTSSKRNNVKTSRERINRALELWQVYGANYSTAVNTYRALLQRKRDLKIRPLSKIPDCVLREFPDIPFLKIGKPDEAEAYLRKLNASEVERLIHRIEYMVEYDYSYHTVSNRVKEFAYQVRHYGQKKKVLGLNPDCIGNGRAVKVGSGGRSRKVDDTK